jgi:hypothetical protein
MSNFEKALVRLRAKSTYQKSQTIQSPSAVQVPLRIVSHSKLQSMGVSPVEIREELLLDRSSRVVCIFPSAAEEQRAAQELGVLYHGQTPTKTGTAHQDR